MLLHHRRLQHLRVLSPAAWAQVVEELAALPVAAEAAFLVRDTPRDYIPSDGWMNDADQRRMMVEYSVENLAVQDKAVKRRKLAERVQGYQTRRRARLRRWFKR